MLITTLLQFAGLSLAVFACGVVLARSADRLGERFRLGRSAAGFLLLAGATSLPELVISGEAARLGEADVAVGDMLGSCLFNLLILGVLDLLWRSRGPMLSARSAAHALSAVAGLLLTGLVGGGLLASAAFGPPAWWPGWLDPTTLAILAGYALCLRVILKDQRAAAAAAGQIKPPDRPGAPPADRWSLWAYLAAAAALVAIGPPTAAVAVRFAEQSGLGGTFVGTTFVAAVTSLPEVVTTAAALRMNAPDLAVGNVLGSNAFNLLVIGLIDPLCASPLLATAGPEHAVTAFAVVTVTAAATVGLLGRRETRVGWIEPDAAAVVLLGAAGFALVYAVS